MKQANRRHEYLPPLIQAIGARQAGYHSCLECGSLVKEQITRCPLCHSRIHARKPNSLTMTTALLLTAVILFFPANLLPTMRTESLIATREDTILSGVIYLWHSGDYPVAIVVFVASFVTPLFKILSIAYLTYTCHKRSKKHIIFRTKLYHINELIGRWSMIDVFVVALLGAMVQMGALATIEPRVGIVAFALVVFLTLFSMKHFDPRLIWDYAHEQTDTQQHHDRKD